VAGFSDNLFSIQRLKCALLPGD